MNSKTQPTLAIRLGILPLSLLMLTQLAIADEHSPSKEPKTQPQKIAVEELVVTGKRPGPPLWRVSSGATSQPGNNKATLWIFGVPETLPKTLAWDPSSVRAIMQDSQAYLSPPNISASVSNPLRVIGVLRAFGKLKKLDRNQRLKDVVPAALYQDFTQVADQFRLPQRRTKKLRPMFAAEALTEQALKRSGLRDSEHLQAQIEKIAKRSKVPVISSTREVDIDRAFEILESPSLDAELDCLQVTLEAVGLDLQRAKRRAQAWANGDAHLLSAMDYPDTNGSCVQNLYNSPLAVTLKAEANRAWLTSAAQVLATNQTSFASLPMRELVHQDGLLKQLEQSGYQVRGQ